MPSIVSLFHAPPSIAPIGLRFSLLAATWCLALVACDASSDVTVGDVPGASPSSDPGTGEASGGTSSAETMLLGATDDGYALVASRPPSSPAAPVVLRRLEVVDVRTGERTVLVDGWGEEDVARIEGHAIATWRSGALSVWTAADGMVAVADRSLPGLFAASKAGLYAFTRDTVGETTTVASSDGAAVPEQRIGGEGVCRIHLAFAGERLFASSCGVGTGAATLRRWNAGDGSVFATVLSNATAEWSADATGASVFVVDAAANGVVVRSTGEAITIDEDIVAGALSPKGDRVVYRTSDLVTKVAMPSPLVISSVATNIRGIVAIAPDFGHVLAVSTESQAGASSTSAPSSSSSPDVPQGDLAIVATVPGKPFIPMPTVVKLVDAPIAEALGFDRAGDFAVYFADVARGVVKVRTVTGREERTLAEGAIAAKVAGDWVVHAHADGAKTRIEATPIVPAAGAARTVEADGPAFAITTGAVVYVAGGVVRVLELR